MTRPPYRISHALYFNLRLKLQAFKLCSRWQYQLRLPEFSGQGIARIEAPALQHLPIGALHSDSQYTGNSRNAIIGQGDNQPQRSAIFIAPDHRRPDAVANPPIDLVEPLRKCLI